MAFYDYLVIDAFAMAPFTGNPAGVILDASRLSDDQMQAIAREINLSETVFVLPSTDPKAAVRFRVFTPSEEALPSGHAILAGVTGMLRAGRFTALVDEPEAILPIEMNDRHVSARVERIAKDSDELLVWIELPRPHLKTYKHDPLKTAGLLGLDADTIDASMPAMTTQDGDVILFVEGYGALMQAGPDFTALAEFSRRRKLRAWCVATLDTLAESVHVQARCFAPVVGVNEDPVTASIQGPLATYLVVADQIGVSERGAAVTCVQSDRSGRAGLVRVLIKRGDSEGYEAWVSGQCFVAMSGQLHVPES